MRFLSSKVTLAVSSNKGEFIKQFMEVLMEKKKIMIGKMVLSPRSYEEIPDPAFETRMRYLCISPLVLHDPRKEPERSQEMLDPTSQQFSDILFDRVLDNMEKAGYPEEQLSSYAEFEATPDAQYVQKINETGKKFARFYKCKEGNPMMGYLIPFTLHAHPEVQKFIWECGMGVLTEQGYGMVDTVK
jgi:CRISPR-associated endoribonuclease Cas6